MQALSNSSVEKKELEDDLQDKIKEIDIRLGLLTAKNQVEGHCHKMMKK